MSTIHNERIAFGQWLKHRRHSLHLTQHTLAKRVGCAVSMLQKLERGVRRPSRELAERLLDALGMSPAERTQILRLANILAADRPYDAAVPGQVVPAAREPLSAHTSALPILLTKILPPPLRRQIVPRPRLSQQLHQEASGGVTLVVAPAGWGKTTLLAAWIASLTEIQKVKGKRQHDETLLSFAFSPLPSNVAWLTLDEHDTDVTHVLRYMIAALQWQHPSLSAAALDLLNTPQPSIEAVLTLIINDVIMLGAPIVLVLDDYHRVTARAVHQTITSLIEHLPPTMRLVIATREDPPLPLARLRARQQLHEIRAADLRFTVEEAASFFAESMNLELHTQEIVALEQRTEGWIAGLQLAALAVREHTNRSDFIHAFTGDDRLVLDYLTEEVLATLPRHQYEFLLQTSILDQLCGPLCDAVLGIENATLNIENESSQQSFSQFSDSYSQIVLDQLERASLFVVPLDRQRQWYRYHHLFGAVLRQRLLRGAAPATIAALHTRAAIWFEGHGLLTEAADHALAAGQWPRAARLIVQVGHALVQSGGIERLRQLIVALPSAICDETPWLLYLHGRCVRQVYDVAAGRVLFERAAAAFARAGDDNGRGQSLILLADCHRMLGAFEEARHALAEALAAPLPPAQRSRALLSQAYEAMAADDWQAVIPTLTRILDLVEQSDDRHALHNVATNLTSLMACLPSGVACLTRVRRLIARQPTPPLSLLHAADLFAYGLMQLVGGQIAAAYATFAQLLDVNDQIGTLSQMHLESVLWYAQCAALCGHIAAADERLGRLLALLEQPTLAVYRQQNGTFSVAMQCLIDWMQGRYDAVRASAAGAEARANSHEWPAVGRLRRLMHGLVLLVECDWTAATHLFEDLYGEQQQLHDPLAFGDAGLLLAHVYLQIGHEADALAILDDVLARHERHGTPGLVLLLGMPTIAPLLRLAVAHDVHAAFAAQTLGMFPHHPEPHRQLATANNALRDVLADPDALTARELEVLRLIALGASNGAIAERLIISVTTVKKHINNLFAKLHVQSRTQALVRAHERGLL